MKLPEKFTIFFWPFLLLITLDLVTTYLGACVLGGFEMNPLAIFIASRIGFLGLSLFQYLSYLCINFFIYFLYSRIDEQVYKIFMVFLWSILLLNYLRTIILNFNTLAYLTTGRTFFPNEMIVSYSEAQVVRAKSFFEAHRKSFCRLI